MHPVFGSTDGKDFLEQLRTIHFSLVILCLTAVVVVNLPDEAKFSRAANDLKSIGDVVNDHHWNNQLVVLAATEAAKGDERCKSDTPFAMDFFTHGPYKVKVERMWDLHSNAPVGYPFVHLDDQLLLPVVDAPNTVSQFQAVWDSEWSLLCPSGKVQPEGHANLAIIILEGQNNYNDKFNGPPMKRLDPGDASEEKTFVFVGERRFEGWPNALLMQVPQAKEPIHQRYAIKVSSPSSIETVRPRSVIMANFPGHKDDTFAKAFPDLSSAAVGWEGIPFAKVKEHLDNLSNEKQVFEAFGIKFPIDSAARWAIVMIFATQAFFWIHLDEYFRRRFAVADVAWIGVYPSRSAKAMSAVTFLLAPAGVCVYLAVKQVAVKQVLVSLKLSQLRPIHWLSDGIFFVVPLMSIGLSVVTGVTYWRGTGSQPIRRKAAVV